MKRIFTLISLTVYWMLTAQAQSFTVGTLNYRVLDASARTVSVIGSAVRSGELIIPETVNYNGTDYTVTSIGDAAFFDCSGFIGDLTIPNSVTSIGNSAFYGCKGFTGSLTIPNSVTSIGNGAFSGCEGFTGDLIIPESIITIGDQSFFFCKGFNGYLSIGSSVKYIGKSAFDNCSKLVGILIIPDSVTTIGSYAFNNCLGFTGSLIIPNSVTSIGIGAFQWCMGFTGSLTIPESVTTIGDWAFYGCEGFTGSLIIPESVRTIGDRAFEFCGGFTDIYCYATNPPTVESSNAFYNYTIPLYVPKGTKEAYQSADVWRNFTNITDNLLSGVGQVGAENGPVDVYSVSGMVVKRQVASEEAKEGLAPGIYILVDRLGNTEKIIIR